MTEQTFPTTHCRFGVARRDVTPPVGIYSRSWGAATHDVAEGVHRPLTATAAVFAPVDGDGPTLALVALDIGWFQYAPDGAALRDAVMERTGLRDAELLIQMSHTHAGANTNSQLTGKPGSDLIVPYLALLADQVGDAVVEAQASAAEAFVSYGYGRCGLAANRDFWDAEAERFACGYNPGEDADDTLLVGRVTAGTEPWRRRSSTTPATRPPSPGRTGSSRPTTSERRARCSRPRSRPRRSSSRAPPGSSRRGTTTSATPPSPTATAASSATPRQPRSRRSRLLPRASPIRGSSPRAPTSAPGGTSPRRPSNSRPPHSSRPSARPSTSHAKRISASSRALTGSTPDSPQEREKALRREFLRLALGDGPAHAMPLWAWRLGEALLVAIGNEPYSVFQQQLRERFPGTPVFVLMTTNGGVGYLPPRETYGTGRYQEQQSPYAPGCLEQSIAEAGDVLARLAPQ